MSSIVGGRTLGKEEALIPMFVCNKLHGDGNLNNCS